MPDDRRHTLFFAARRFPDHTRISGGLGSRAAEGHQTGKVLVEGQGTHHGVQRCIQEVYFDVDGAFRTGVIESSPRGLVPREIALYHSKVDIAVTMRRTRGPWRRCETRCANFMKCKNCSKQEPRVNFF